MVPVCLVLEVVPFLLVCMVCMLFLTYELVKTNALDQYSQIGVSRRGQWFLLDLERGAKLIRFKNSIHLGSVIMILFKLNGEKQRALIFKKNQLPMQFHNLKVYLKLPR